MNELTEQQIATIKDAAEAARDGDTVLVADGVYGGPGWRHLGTNGRDVIIRSANGPANCIIDNATDTELLNLAGAAVTGVQPDTITLVSNILQRPGTVVCATSALAG